MTASPAYATALITGASSGIGAALATRLAARGVHVVVAARRRALLDELTSTIVAQGGRATALELDVSQTAEVVSTLTRLDDELGGIDLVIANAGVGLNRDAKELTWKDVEPVLLVNVLGALATLSALLPRMVARRAGHLVGVSSLAQYRALPTSAAYSASKAAVSTFLEGLRVDLRGTGVATTDIRPGFIQTPILIEEVRDKSYVMALDPAADMVLDAILRKAEVFAFPFAMAQLASFSRWLPNALYDPLVTALKP